MEFKSIGDVKNHPGRGHVFTDTTHSEEEDLNEQWVSHNNDCMIYLYLCTKEIPADSQNIKCRGEGADI